MAKRGIKTIIKLIDTLLSISFFISTIFIAFVINSFFVLSGLGLAPGIAFLVENRAYSVLLILFWLFLCIWKTNNDSKIKEIEESKLVIHEKERQIEMVSGVLEAKFGDIADSINAKRLKKILHGAIVRFPFVEACHLYDYELHRTNSHISIKLKFNLGEEQENTCVNVIKQNYYSVDKDIYKSINEFSNFENDTRLSDVSSKMTEVLDSIDKSKHDSCLKFRLNEIAMFIFCKLSNIKNVGFKENVAFVDKAKLLGSDSSRTGILGCILTHSGYVYRYQKQNEDKRGRIYYAAPIVLDTDYILNLIIGGHDLSITDINDTILQVVTFIHEEYNKLTGGI